MTAGIANADIYTDFSSLNKLRHQAKGDPDNAIGAVAKQFESIFIGMMLKSMRDASLGDPIFDSDQGGFYKDMFDKQLSLTLASGKGIGIAEIVTRQLQGLEGKLLKRGEDTKALDNISRNITKHTHTINSNENVAKAVADVKFNTPKKFLETIYPHAEEAAKELGVDVKALLAQASLETGWGKKIIRHHNGEISHNLFNIKADQRWDGKRAQKTSLEFIDGIAVKVQSFFRSYETFAESFKDYVSFIKESPRYLGALKNAFDPKLYINELQRAGYATDPEYSNKINRIMDGELIAATLNGV
jgi:flagellar protein FlgJ